MSCNRELVVHYIKYKLSQRNYPISLLKLDDASGSAERDEAAKATSNGFLANATSVVGQLKGLAPPSGGLDAVKAALQESADKFELLFAQAFSQLSSEVDITPDTAYPNFKSVVDVVFEDGVNWGRVVALFAFGGAICVKCLEKGMSELVVSIADWMTMYLDEHLSPWIQSQGGWDCFAEMFGGDAALRRESQEIMRRWLLVGGVLLAGVMVGMFFAKKQ